jgi:hypothetical protein
LKECNARQGSLVTAFSAFRVHLERTWTEAG